MATTAQWIEGARPRTLPNAIAPVLVGTGAAVSLDGGVWWKALLALVVSLALIVGVNFANDYSDGIRGTDDDRVGPLRLVGSKAASAGAVKKAAIGCFAVGAVAGLVLAATSAWWLVIVGLVCIAGAWYYTGGSKPYGYSGFGEIAVFVFFGLVAVLGTQFVQAEQIDWAGVLAAVAVGSFSSAVLVANNLRDIPTDTESGKLTLAVRLGDTRTRYLHLALLVVPFAMTVVLIARTPWALVGLLALPFAARANSPVRKGAHGFELIPALRDSGLAMLVWGASTGVALAFA
ncbi:MULTISPECIES: 1,4-dihydroxy-2-naphthoate polyprenyltransferase [unclassified Rhodococcus (in: high G+C Gram-positive bacteria)]|uniref:1,4-dihydroxy-2-naphthoate polyprenyltransferase n=1 Tax=unclassified Rhodococcus (in: high G+C Gram-positive bacteria) TaxID=192944 RepID=UPI000EF87094|nr:MULTISPECIES: 1,4-dihydroxy-2-naphthoate polyprenyltransferase [unclassified Rhodococcus (in: high G+C Gram-positive bacteria)]KAA0925315.1 1,4-dihydroxy-2-naphthoate polyprenyltransferase [Rhodococcus sp. ANT_H53B]MDI9928518.1 1,4-dihydroxy-2-naphthoate polyprenyltransferase [Rhodococcus sp. IEGM 1341]MDZ7929869.1 1,4-dihydroxy-2-naphthoate polyprenyltransferase [Rhodococcus sp. (in: high G+C Gram-positive bacteria)]RMB72253.1 1,4-dihydroxy-2-naphthoate polyprenyltransferase [Rhodococcus sp